MDKTKMDSAHKSSTGSLRLNSGKPEMSQLDPRFLVALADLLTVSAKKYGKFNWALGQEFHTPYDSLQRHLMLFMSGEDDDAESGHSHLMHAAANIMIMWTSQQLGDERLDTRFDWNRVKDKEAKDVIKRHGGLSDEDLENMHIEDTLRQKMDKLEVDEARKFKIGDKVKIINVRLGGFINGTECVLVELCEDITSHWGLEAEILGAKEIKYHVNDEFELITAVEDLEITHHEDAIRRKYDK